MSVIQVLCPSETSPRSVADHLRKVQSYPSSLSFLLSALTHSTPIIDDAVFVINYVEATCVCHGLVFPSVFSR